jgi:hypothetical protein
MEMLKMFLTCCALSHDIDIASSKPTNGLVGMELQPCSNLLEYNTSNASIEPSRRYAISNSAGVILALHGVSLSSD